MGGCVSNRPNNIPDGQRVQENVHKNGQKPPFANQSQVRVGNPIESKSQIKNSNMNKNDNSRINNTNIQNSKMTNQMSKQIMGRIYQLLQRQIQKSKLGIVDYPQDDIYSREIQLKELAQLYETSGNNSKKFIQNLQQKISTVYIELSSKTLQGMNDKKFIENQSKVFISQQILWQNLIIMKIIGKKEGHKFNENMFRQLNQLQKNLLGYLKMKYPRGSSMFVSNQLAKSFQNTNTLQHPKNETLQKCKYYFGRQQQQPLMKDIKTFLNKIMKQLDDKFSDFSKLLVDEIFQIKIDEGQKKLLQNKIGRKLPENTPTFNVDSRYFQIKSPELLRVFIKWVDYLEEYFLDPDSVIDSKDYLKIIVGFENNKPIFNVISKVEQAQNLYKKLKSKLKQQKKEYEKEIYKIKLEIDRFNSNLIKIMDRRQRQQRYVPLKDADLIKYAMLNTNMLQWMIARKLVILMQKLIKIGKQLTNNLILDLISFNVTDLLRAMVFCQKNQIVLVYENMRRLEQQKMIKILKIKNRLNTPLNDVMVIFRFRGCFLSCQLQLVLTQKTRSEDSDKIKNIESLNHFLYELERSPYGVQSQLAALLGYKDNKTKYENEIKYTPCEHQNFSTCQRTHNQKIKTMKIQNIPFICTFCTEFYRENTNSFGIKVCSQCNDFICSRCLLKMMKSNDKEDLKIQLINNVSTKYYQSRRMAKIKKQELPSVKSTEFLYEIYDFDALTKLYEVPGVVNSTLSKKDLTKFINMKIKSGWCKYMLLITFFNDKMRIKHVEIYEKQLELSFPQKDQIPQQIPIGVKDFIIPYRSKGAKNQIQIKSIDMKPFQQGFFYQEDNQGQSSCDEDNNNNEDQLQQMLSINPQTRIIQYANYQEQQAEIQANNIQPEIQMMQRQFQPPLKYLGIDKNKTSKLFDLYNKQINEEEIAKYYYLEFKQKQEIKVEPKGKEKGYSQQVEMKKGLASEAMKTKTINILISVDHINEQYNKQKLKFPYNSLQQALKKKPNILSTFQIMDFSQCGITDDKLTYFQNTDIKEEVRQLNLAKNRINEVKIIFDNLRYIRVLFLQRNNIQKIEITQLMSKLQILNVSYNVIKTFRGLKYLKMITKLDISNNPLAYFEQLQYQQDDFSLPKLQILNLSYMYLRDTSFFEMTQFPQLIQLDLIQSFDKYKTYMMPPLALIYPKLKYLKISQYYSPQLLYLECPLQSLTLKNVKTREIHLMTQYLKYLTLYKLIANFKRLDEQQTWLPMQIKIEASIIYNYDEFMMFKADDLKFASIKNLRNSNNKTFEIFNTFSPLPMPTLQKLQIKQCIVKDNQFSKLIFEKLKSLVFFNCKLQSINAIHKMNLDTLTNLNLTSNQLTSLVPINLPNLQQANLGRNQLIDIRKLSNWNTPNLQVLILSDNRIKQFTKINFPKLTLLDLTNNPDLKNIEELRNSKFGKGIVFNMQDCEIVDFPSLNDQATVTTLNLKMNNLVCIGKIKQIRKLNISQNEFKSFPKLTECKALYQIDASQNRIEDIRQFFPKISQNLIILNLANNELKQLPPITNKYIKLQEIILNNNYLTNISQFCKQIPYNLKILDCMNNDIVDFPKINGLGLTEIDLSDNSIQYVDFTGCKLSRECRFFLSMNEIKDVKPIQIALKSLDLQSNKLKSTSFLDNQKAEIQQIILNNNDLIQLSRIPKNCILFYADDNKIQNLGNFLQSECDSLSLKGVIEIIGNVQNIQKMICTIQKFSPQINIECLIKPSRAQSLRNVPTGEICSYCNKKLDDYFYWCKWQKKTGYSTSPYEGSSYAKRAFKKSLISYSSMNPSITSPSTSMSPQQNVGQTLRCRQCIQSIQQQMPYKYNHNSILISKDTKLVVASMLGNDIQPPQNQEIYNQNSETETDDKYIPDFTCIVCQQYFKNKGMPRYICLQYDYQSDPKKELNDVCQPCMKKYIEGQKQARLKIPETVRSFLRVQYQTSYYYY